MSLPCQKESEIATLVADVQNLKGWQKSQNGKIDRINEKLDKLINVMLKTSISFVVGSVAVIVTLISLML